MDGQKYFEELSRHLRRDGLTPAEPQDGLMPVEREGRELCQVTAEGGVRYRPEVRQDPELERALSRVTDTASTVAEYMKLLEAAPPLKAVGLDEADGYRLLADFNGTVLAGMRSSYGAQFVTWDWNYEHTGLGHGHYYDDYKAAKQDFAARSGLVPEKALFTREQLTDLYECIEDTQRSCGDSSDDFDKRLDKLREQIEELVPGVQNHGTLELENPMTVREFLTRHPRATVSMMTPVGCCYLTPDAAKEALAGRGVITFGLNCSDTSIVMGADALLDEEVHSGSFSKGIWHLLTDHPKQELVEPQGPQMGGMAQMGM